MVRITCPNCQQTFDVVERIVGRQAKCSGCGTRFVVEQAIAPFEPTVSSPIKRPLPPPAEKVDAAMQEILGLSVPAVPVGPAPQKSQRSSKRLTLHGCDRCNQHGLVVLA